MNKIVLTKRSDIIEDVLTTAEHFFSYQSFTEAILILGTKKKLLLEEQLRRNLIVSGTFKLSKHDVFETPYGTLLIHEGVKEDTLDIVELPIR